MKSSLARTLFFGIFLFSFALPLLALTVPLQADAALVACGLSNGTAAEMAPCTLCHLIKLGADVIAWIMQIMTIVAVAAIFAMGILYIVSAGNQSMMQKAKGGIWAALIGFALVLSAWLIVNLVLTLLADNASGPLANFQQTGTFSFTCDASSTAGTAAVVSAITGSTSSLGTGGTGSTTGGTCTPYTNSPSNPCDVSNLSSSCFGQNANKMSQICRIESQGNPSARSGVDICGNYGNRAFSGGLFQINVFSNGGQLSPRCSNLGSKGTCTNRRASDNVCLSWNCQINNTVDFDYCMGLTFNAQSNIQAACRLSGNGSNVQPWRTTAQRCSIP